MTIKADSEAAPEKKEVLYREVLYKHVTYGVLITKKNGRYTFDGPRVLTEEEVEQSVNIGI